MKPCVVHCWHYPRNFYLDRDEAGRQHTVTCCDCGEEAWIETVNRGPGAHGPHRLGEAVQLHQRRVLPSIRVLPRVRR